MRSLLHRMFLGKSRAGTYSLIIILFNGILSFLIRRNLSLGLVSEDFGFFYSLFSFFATFGVIVNFGLSHSAVLLIAKYQSSGDRQGAKRIFAGLVILKLGITILFFLLLNLIAPALLRGYFLKPEGGSAYIFMSLWFIGDSIGNAAMAFFEAMKNFVARNLVLFLDYLIVLLLLIFDSLDGNSSLQTATLSYAIGFFIPGFIGFTYILLKYRIHPFIRVKSIKIGAAELFSIGKWVAVSTAGLFVIFNLDTIMLTSMTTLRDVADYNIAIPIMQIFLSFMILIPQIGIPTLAYHWNAGSYGECRKELLQKNILAIIIGVLAVPCSLLLGESVIGLLFGKQYMHVYLVATLLIFAVPFNVLANFHIGVQNIGGYEKRAALLVLGGVGLNVLLDWLFIPTWGTIGAAMASLSVYLFLFISNSLLNSRLLAQKIGEQIS